MLSISHHRLTLNGAPMRFVPAVDTRGAMF